jgi:hypothetical protein
VTASMQAHMPGLDAFLGRVNRREEDEQAAFEERAEKAGCALMNELERLDTAPQHVRDAAYLELIAAIFPGSKWGRNELHSLLEKVAQDVEREPSEAVIRWFGGGR